LPTALPMSTINSTKYLCTLSFIYLLNVELYTNYRKKKGKHAFSSLIISEF